MFQNTGRPSYKVKFWSEATADELKKNLNLEDLDENTHRIIQHKIR
jgi:hypothetical protein